MVGAPGIVELSHDDSRSRAIERLPDPVIDAIEVYTEEVDLTFDARFPDQIVHILSSDPRLS